jgi:23S rRNA m(5)U-1939 methyltransferase (EC 2.1.1.-)
VPKTQWICFRERTHLYDIHSVLSSHVETVVSLSHKKADTHININVEFGDDKGQIPIDEIARKDEEPNLTKR